MKAVLRYLGAKNTLAEWILSFFPDHKCYVEPFGGSAAVLLNKKPSPIEIYNDKLGTIVTFFKVLRDNPDELIKAIELTPYAKDEYYEAIKFDGTTDIEIARQFAVFSMMGYGGVTSKSGFRKGGAKRHPSCPRSWDNYPRTLNQAAKRLKNVEINNCDAIDLMRLYDTKETLHYVDPPYPHETRRSANCRYKHELNHEDHIALLEYLNTLEGKVVLSTYENTLYDDHLSHWRKVTKESTTTQNTKRMEILYMNFEWEPLLPLF